MSVSKKRSRPETSEGSDSDSDDAPLCKRLKTSVNMEARAVRNSMQDNNSSSSDDDDDIPILKRRQLLTNGTSTATAPMRSTKLNGTTPTNSAVKRERSNDIPPLKRAAPVKREPKRLVEPKRPARPRKMLKKTEENFEPVNCWWAKEPNEDGVEWHYLEHHGTIFAPPYAPHNLPVKYAGHNVALPPRAEEIIKYWCGAQNSEYATKKIYVNNFWNAFLYRLPSDHPIKTGVFTGTGDTSSVSATGSPSGSRKAEGDAFAALEVVAASEVKEESAHASQGTSAVRRIEVAVAPKKEPASDRQQTKAPDTKAKFELLDCSRIMQHFEDLKLRKAEMTKEEKAEQAARNQSIEAPYQHCLFDWLREKVGNIKMEPPALFRGRGAHPKMGKLKRRVFPDEVIINCAEDAPVPRVAPALCGHAWKDIFYDNKVTWLAFYKDSVNRQVKYVRLAGGSVVKGKSDNQKYEKARKLKGCIDIVRKDYQGKMLSREIIDRQLGTATYLIDVLALRIGNEKDTTELADTVGCCSLRVEHASFKEETTELTLDFLGKDSIRYFNTTVIDKVAFKNLTSFCKGKSQDSVIFDKISTTHLNKYLKELMPLLSAKVFRTYNASITLQSELKKIHDTDTDVTNAESVIRFYNDANRRVAILCNHQRTVPKQHDASMGRIQRQKENLEEDKNELLAYTKHLKRKSTQTFKYETTIKTEEGETPRKGAVKSGMKDAQVQARLNQISNKIANLELRMRVKDDNKTVSNTTSKQHYMDPRITVALCKKFEVPIEKLFTKALQKTFTWAMHVKTEWEF